MDGIAGIQGVYGGAMANPAQPMAGLSSAAAGQSVASITSTSMSAQVESFVAVSGAAANNNELLGAVLLMLILEYLKTEDSSKKHDLLSLISALAQQQGQGGGGGGMMMYQSASFSMESMQIQVASAQSVAAAYSGASATLQQAPAADPGAAGLNVVA